jgi:structural maintenance of chromosome 4
MEVEPLATEKLTNPTFDEDKPRLTIRSLVLENFKSYAGRQEIGPFHSCFSAVVVC